MFHLMKFWKTVCFSKDSSLHVANPVFTVTVGMASNPWDSIGALPADTILDDSVLMQ